MLSKIIIGSQNDKIHNHRIEKIKTGEKMNEEKFKKLFEKHFLPKGWDIESFDDTKIGYHTMSNWFGNMTAKEFYEIIKKFYNKFKNSEIANGDSRQNEHVGFKCPESSESALNDLLSVAVDNGKYTVVQDHNGALRALRYGKEWYE